MIKLSDLIETNKLKSEIPHSPFDKTKDSENELYVDDHKDDYRYDDDNNMTDDEWDDFQEYLNGWLDDIRQKGLTKKMIDVDELITEFMLMDEPTREGLDQMSSKEINKITKILHQKRKEGNTCHFYKRYGIKYLGDRGKLKYDWEKDYYNRHHRI